MSTATVTTDINIGPFKIPANGQNMIMNNYAERNKIAVELVIPEPFKSNALATTQWLHKDLQLTKVILCSIYQLPQKKEWFDELLINMNNVEFHFALEGLSGTGRKFILSCIKEVKMFESAKNINSSETSWSDLFKMMREQKKNR